MTQLYASIAGVSGITNIQVTDSHNSATTTCIITAKNTTLDIGDSITAYLGYIGDNGKIFYGYVKQIEHVIPDDTYIITCNDVLIRAIDYFIAPTNPENPYKKKNITAEALVEDLMNLAGLTNFTSETSYFTFGINNSFEVKLVSSYDFCKQVADIIAFTLWADRNGQVHFEDRKPYPDGDSSVATLDDTNTYNLLNVNYRESDRDLRNRVLVYGASGVYAEAKASSPYLPAGFYKTVVAASPLIDLHSTAQNAADYNLAMLNRLTKEISVIAIGDWQYQARTVVTIDEEYTGISGDWYVYSVSHNWSQTGYTTTLELRV